MMDDPVVVEDLLSRASVRLRSAGIETARLDARILLGHVLGREASSLLPGDSTPVQSSDVAVFDSLTLRREASEPVSRIIGEREFYGRPFVIGPAVLDPRSDSESVVELALELSGDFQHVLDLGTGSGCLLLTLLAERPSAIGTGVDQSAEALEIAVENAGKLGLAGRCNFVTSDWLTGIEGGFDLIISNPPYIPARDILALMPDVRLHDPHLALDGGADGLSAYRIILEGARKHLNVGGFLVLEIGEGQAAPIAEIARDAGFVSAGTKSDLGGHVRGLAFTFPS
jgi:release factor glutamine methyltransferase